MFAKAPLDRLIETPAILSRETAVVQGRDPSDTERGRMIGGQQPLDFRLCRDCCVDCISQDVHADAALDRLDVQLCDGLGIVKQWAGLYPDRLRPPFRLDIDGWRMARGDP